MSIPFNNANPEWDRILIASQKNNALLIEQLITKMEVSPNHANGVGQSGLHVAALWGNLDAVEMLLKHNANPNAQNKINGATPLHSAVQSMKKPISMRTRSIQKILEHESCNPHMTDSNGFTPLVCLEKILERESARFTPGDKEDLYEMKEVLQNAMSQLESERYPLFQMIEEYDVDAMKQILNTGDPELIRRINEQDCQTAYSPLSYVIAKIVAEVEQMMYDPPDEQAIIQIETLKEIVLLLLKCGAEVQVTVFIIPGKPEQQKDPFEEICTTLSDIILEAENDDDYARVISALKEIAVELYNSGADISTKTMLCLHSAARRGKLEIVQFWIEKLNVDINVKGRQGLTPLHFAARSGKLGAVKYLLQNDAIDVNVLDDRGKKAIDAAIVNGKEDIAHLIRQKSSS